MSRLFIAKTGYKEFTVYEVCEECGYSHDIVAKCEDAYEAQRIVDALDKAKT